MRHIAIQRTGTIHFHTACPYCNHREVGKHPHILDALKALDEHIRRDHPLVIQQYNHRNQAVNQLMMEFPGSELA